MALQRPSSKAPHEHQKSDENQSAEGATHTEPAIPCYLAMCRQALLNRHIVAFSAAGFNLIAVESRTTALARLASFLPGFSLVYHTDHMLMLFVGHPLAGWYQSRRLPPHAATSCADASSMQGFKQRGYRRLWFAYRYFDHCALVLSIPYQHAEILSAPDSCPQIAALEQLLVQARALMSGVCERNEVPVTLRHAPFSCPACLSQLWLAGKPFAHSEDILSEALNLPVKRFSPSQLFSCATLDEPCASSVLDKTNPLGETAASDLWPERFTLPLALAWRGAYTC